MRRETKRFAAGQLDGAMGCFLGCLEEQPLAGSGAQSVSQGKQASSATVYYYGGK